MSGFHRDKTAESPGEMADITLRMMGRHAPPEDVGVILEYHDRVHGVPVLDTDVLVEDVRLTDAPAELLDEPIESVVSDPA